MKKPIVVIVGEDGYDERSYNSHFVICKKYGTCIREAGGVPVLAYDFRTIAEYVQLGDGLLLTEGPQMHPAWYGQIADGAQDISGVSATRDSMDFMMCRAFLEAGKPVMGIGRGAKVLQLAVREEQRNLIIGVPCSDEVFRDREKFREFLKLCGRDGDGE